MPPHGHAEEEEVIVVRTDGPPFVDLKAKQGMGFENDFDKVQKHLGPGKLSLADFARDIATINNSYIPTAYRSGFYLKIGVNLLLADFFTFVVMGIIGEYAGEARGTITLILVVIFLVGMLSFFYSKWIEQGGIRQGAELVRKMIDMDINPRYEGSPFRIKWTVNVRRKSKKDYHLGKEMFDRPVVTIYALRSENASGVMTDWEVPPELLQGLYVDDSALKVEGLPGGGAAAGGH